ncbi:hypothetical protein FG05_35390 [Fusarium graminearum]|nr:hypothetical protein FG05_35390 [Fusarium graminearum]
MEFLRFPAWKVPSIQFRTAPALSTSRDSGQWPPTVTDTGALGLSVPA